MGNRQDICILGGTGNVGYAAYKALEKSNYYFRIGVRNRDKAEKMNLYKRDNVQLFEIDLDKSSSVNEFCDGANIIIGAIGPSTKYSEKMLKIALEMKIPYIDPGGMYLKNKYSNREIDITAIVGAGLFPGVSGWLLYSELKRRGGKQLIEIVIGGKYNFSRGAAIDYVEEIKEKINNKDIKTDKITMFSYLTKLRQLCLDPSVLIEGYNKKSSKTEATLEILKDYIEDNHKILLFSQFTSVLKNIGKELSKNNIDYYYIDGQTNALERLNLVNKFNEDEDVKVFLISLKAGGSGLNLTSADVVIHFDPWWNPAVENQASDRVHRFGQKNVVHIIKLIAKGTIEENIIKLQENKDKLIKDFINDDLSNSGLLKSLSDKDIIDLFS